MGAQGAAAAGPHAALVEPDCATTCLPSSPNGSKLDLVLLKADIPDRLRADLLASEDLCKLLARHPPIGMTAAGYL